MWQIGCVFIVFDVIIETQNLLHVIRSLALHFWGRFMLFNLHMFNYMLLCFFPLAFICSSQFYASCFGYPQCFGAISLFMIIDLCTFCKAFSWKLLWMKVSAKWIHVNVANTCLIPLQGHGTLISLATLKPICSLSYLELRSTTAEISDCMQC